MVVSSFLNSSAGIARAAKSGRVGALLYQLWACEAAADPRPQKKRTPRRCTQSCYGCDHPQKKSVQRPHINMKLRNSPNLFPHDSPVIFPNHRSF